MKRNNSYITFLGFLLILISVVFIVYAAVISRIFRDGLGPDAIDSHGLAPFDDFSAALAPCY
jgi:hypothetical protein